MNARDVFFVGDADQEVGAPDGKARQIDDLGFEQVFVGQTDQQVVEGPELDREQIDRDDLAGGGADADDVADLERPLTHQEQAADHVRRRGLRREAQGHGQHTCGAEQDAEVEPCLVQGDGDHQADGQVAHGPAGDHRVLGAEVAGQEALGAAAESPSQEPTGDQDQAGGREPNHPIFGEEVLDAQPQVVHGPTPETRSGRERRRFGRP